MNVVRKYHKDGIRPMPTQVFVFGSNQSGIHGAGAARAALGYGAEHGEGFGLHGNTYAIPTKDYSIRTLPIGKVKDYIDTFIAFTKANPEKQFLVTRVGCGLAGFEDSQIAPLFKDAINCSFADAWKEYLEV